MIKKFSEEPNKDLALGLLEYRNTSKNLETPNEIMYGRKMKGFILNKIDENDNKKYSKIKNVLKERQNSQKEYYNKNAHNLKPVKINDQVYVRKEIKKL